MKFLSNILVKAGLVVEGSAQFNSLAGVGTRMVVTNAAGVVSTQAIPLVNSVFGRTGSVVAQAGDYTTAQVTESGNLYYTDARARAAISVAGSGTYNPSTGVITINGGVTSVNTLTGAVVLTTSNISEGTNLYYTDARARASISLTTTGGSGAATYIGGVLNIPNYTLAGLGGVGGTGVANELAYFSTPSVIGNLPVATYPSLTEISYVKGVTSSIQTQINSKQNTITLTTTGTSGAATLIGNTLNIPNYTSAANVTGSAATGQMAFWTGASAIGGNANFVWDNAQSRLGVNIATPLHTIDVAGSARITGTVAIASSAFNQAGAESSIHIGRSMTAQTSYGSTIRYEAQTGVSSAHGMQVQLSTQNALFTVANIYGISVLGTIKGASNTITNQYGFFVNSTFNAATNNYAFYGDIGVGAGMWNVYMAGSASNYFAGRVLIGGATDDNTNALQVAGSFIATSNSTINGVSVGRGAGNVATNTSLGASALITNSTGAQNTAVGNEALRLNTTGLQNSAFGYRASRATTTGSANSSFGIDTLRLNSIGNYNSAFGAQALDNNTSNNNTAIGSQSLLDNTTGTNNTALGYRAGYAGLLLSNVTGSNNIFIGADSIGESTSASNRTFIGNTSTTSTWLGGRLLLGSRTDDAANMLQVTGTSALVGVTYVNTNASIAGYGHSLQVLANAAGGMVISTTNSASAIGIINSSSANKTWDISPNNNDLAINESGVGPRMYFLAGGNITVGGITNSSNLFEVLGTFKTTGVNTLSNLQGTGSRMVVADANGVLSTQAIPAGSITGTAAFGQVAYWSGASSQAGNAGFTFSPGSRLFLNNTVIASSSVARGFHVTSQLSAFANNDDLVGIDLSPVYTTSGPITGVSSIAIRTASSFTPTQGDIRYTAFSIQPSINQGGTATGITRGVHVNPTITAVVDWRSVEWSNNAGWGLYGVGTSKNYLNGTTLIGTATDDNVNKLQVAGNIKAAGIVRSDASRTAAINDVSIALLGSNITTYGAGFVMGAAGYGLNAIYAQHEQRFGGNAQFSSANLVGGGLILNKLAPTAAGTVTMDQIPTTGTVTNIRTMSNLHLMTQFEGNNNLTVTHMSGLHIYGHYRTSGTGEITVSGAYYGVLLADPNEFGAGATITGSNWGFYQQGTNPVNHFGGSVLIGTTTTDADNKVVVNGSLRASQFRLTSMNTAPATATSAGTLGEIRIDANNIYVCTATNTWRRVGIATF